MRTVPARRPGPRRFVPVACALGVLLAWPAGLARAVTVAAPAALAWGDNSEGQLGDGGTVSSSTPVMVQGLPGVGCPAGAPPTCAPLAGGQRHSLALKTDGTVWAWGGNQSDVYTFGQLGDGTTAQRLAPVQVHGLSSVVGISTKGEHSLAVRRDGTVWAWGANQSAQLGDGTSCDYDTHIGCSRTLPVEVIGPGGHGHLSGVTAVAAGVTHSLALMADGTVWAWGSNGSGELGRGGSSLGTSAAPAPIVGPAVGVLPRMVAVAAGNAFSLALGADGSVWGWGDASYGQLGDGQPMGSHHTTSPELVLGFARGTAITAGTRHSVALSSDGAVWAWGDNLSGQLGVPGCPDAAANVCGSSTPLLVAAARPAIAVAAGSAHTMALSDAASGHVVWAWGADSSGQLGDGSTTDRSIPVPVATLAGVTAIASGLEHSLAWEVPGSPAPGGASLLPGALSFGPQAVGSASPSQGVTLTNHDPTTLTITAISTTGDFAQTSGCGANLAPAQSCTISVRFRPTASGSRGGTLSVRDNASNGLTQTVTLSGVGTATRAVPPPLASAISPGCGRTAGGDTVTVTGSGFIPGNTSLELDATPVAAAVMSAGQLTAVTPRHADGVVPARVITTAGASAPVDFTYSDRCLLSIGAVLATEVGGPSAGAGYGNHGAGLGPLTPGTPGGAPGLAPNSVSAPGTSASTAAMSSTTAPGALPAAQPQPFAVPGIGAVPQPEARPAPDHAMVGHREEPVATLAAPPVGGVAMFGCCLLMVRRRSVASCRPSAQPAW